MKKGATIKLQIKFKYSTGALKTIEYEFKSKDAFTIWLEKADADQSIRKVTNKDELKEKTDKAQ